MSRPITLWGLAALALLASACGTDDSIGATSSTTIPQVTAGADESTDSTDPTTTEPTTADSGDTTTTTVDGRTVPGDLTAVAVGLSPLVQLDAPIDSVAAPNGELWIASRPGTISVIDPTAGDVLDTILDISDETSLQGERGLLGLAVDDLHLFINFTDLDGNTNVDSFTLDDAGRPGERRNLLVIEQPFANHNGGGLAIGPDGHLYIGVGDGGAANDPLLAGQDPTQILGSILRIDPTPDDTDPYAIPAENPYADGTAGQPEIFMIGLRNPWRFAFDPITDDLWIADVGQNQWEEINLLLGANGWGLGANLGWNLREGTREFTGDTPEGNVDPVFEYPHSGGTPSGCSVSGGQVYRGTAIPDLVGAYVFADYCESSLWAIAIVDGTVVFRDLETPVDNIVGITADTDGELLALSLSGSVSRLVAQ